MNTIVIFVSDHGYMLQEHTQWASSQIITQQHRFNYI